MTLATGVVMTIVTLLGQAPPVSAPAPADASATAPPVYVPGSKLYVVASGLAFRRGPSLETERIHYIPLGDTVTVLEDNRVPVSFESDGKTGHWIYVQHGAYKGYVFDAFLSPTPPAAPATPPTGPGASVDRNDWVFVPGLRVGPITAQTSYQTLIDSFGATNVAEAIVDIAEGETEPGTAVYPKTPDQAVIQWAEYRKSVKAVYIWKDGSHWKSRDGIQIGTPLETLVQRNGKPITMSGMGSDESGYVTSWNGGTLEQNYPLGTGFEISFKPTEPYKQDDYLALSEAETITSELPLVARLHLRVGRMVIHLAKQPAAIPSAVSRTSERSGSVYAPGTQVYTYASKLNMRAEPALGSPVIAGVPYGTRVLVSERTAEPAVLEAENLRGHWLLVDYSGQRGYVFDAFLLPIPAPRPGSVGLLAYAQSSLKPAGEIRREKAGEGNEARTIATQDYEGGVRLEDRSWSNLATSGHERSLIVPGVTCDQALVFVRKCIPHLADALWARGNDGSITVRDTGGTVLIKPEPAGGIRIVEREVTP